MKCYRIIFFIFLFCYGNKGLTDEHDLYFFSRTQDAQRFTALTQSIRCVVCSYQTIHDSNAPLAKDLRDKIYQMIKAQQSNASIKQYLVKRYGDFILLQPRLTKLTFFLWLFPFFGIFTAILWLFRMLMLQLR